MLFCLKTSRVKYRKDVPIHDVKQGGRTMRFMIQYAFTLSVLVFSTFVAWYEGSELRDNPWEWKHSAIFSHMLYGSVTDSQDISQLDHFIYAAKFKPAFPILMALSFVYVVTLTGYVLLRRDVRKLTVFCFAFGVLLFVLGAVVANSPTEGGHYFTVLFMTGCLLHVLASFWLSIKLKRARNA